MFRSTKDNPVPSGKTEVADVREQLERMLAGRLFTHSRRYPAMLRYIVEKTLDGGAEGLKERTLGVAVFGRDPTYDTALDPVVRATAGEIRKRLAQYYQEPGHEREIRISLSPGSYVPEFTLPAPPIPAQPEPAPPVTPAPAALPVPATSARRWFPRLLISAIVLLTVLATAGAWLSMRSPGTALDRFWRPVVESSDPVLICIGQRRFFGAYPEPGQEKSDDIERIRRQADPRAPTSLFQLYYLGSQNVALPDVATFGRLSGLLRAHEKNYHMRNEYSTTFADLRNGPVVLVGAFNNDWTMRLMGSMRFSFERNSETFWIRDRQKPNDRTRAVNYSMPYMNLTRDYALISRVLEPTTDRMVVLAGGLTGYGTVAAGEFLTDPKYLTAFAQDAPAGWDRRNIQVVIETNVIRGVSGPPHVVERNIW